MDDWLDRLPPLPMTSRTLLLATLMACCIPLVGCEERSYSSDTILPADTIATETGTGQSLIVHLYPHPCDPSKSILVPETIAPMANDCGMTPSNNRR